VSEWLKSPPKPLSDALKCRERLRAVNRSDGARFRWLTGLGTDPTRRRGEPQGSSLERLLSRLREPFVEFEPQSTTDAENMEAAFKKRSIASGYLDIAARPLLRGATWHLS